MDMMRMQRNCLRFFLTRYSNNHYTHTHIYIYIRDSSVQFRSKSLSPYQGS